MILSKGIWKTAHFDANCMEIGFLLSKHDWKIVDWDVKPQHKQTYFQIYG